MRKLNYFCGRNIDALRITVAVRFGKHPNDSEFKENGLPTTGRSYRGVIYDE